MQHDDQRKRCRCGPGNGRHIEFVGTGAKYSLMRSVLKRCSSRNPCLRPGCRRNGYSSFSTGISAAGRSFARSLCRFVDRFSGFFDRAFLWFGRPKDRVPHVGDCRNARASQFALCLCTGASERIVHLTSQIWKGSGTKGKSRSSQFRRLPKTAPCPLHVRI